MSVAWGQRPNVGKKNLCPQLHTLYKNCAGITSWNLTNPADHNLLIWTLGYHEWPVYQLTATLDALGLIMASRRSIHRTFFYPYSLYFGTYEDIIQTFASWRILDLTTLLKKVDYNYSHQAFAKRLKKLEDSGYLSSVYF